PKSSTEIGVTSICKEYNHLILHDVELYTSKYRKLSDSIMKNIKLYITKNNIEAKQIYSLLVAKFLDYNILKRFKSSFTN
ncbi:12869_t:CDS:1, partial [Cetraspora pellucida]